MNNTNSAEDLGQRIEQMIKEHIAASRDCAQQAIARAFANAARASTPTVASRRVRSAPVIKRPPADIAALGERFYEAVCAKPGETMTILAVDVGAHFTARVLGRWPADAARRCRRELLHKRPSSACEGWPLSSRP